MCYIGRVSRRCERSGCGKRKGVGNFKVFVLSIRKGGVYELS